MIKASKTKKECITLQGANEDTHRSLWLILKLYYFKKKKKKTSTNAKFMLLTPSLSLDVGL